MIARLDSIVFGMAVGWLSAHLGCGADSWQFWIFAMPLTVWYGFMRAIKMP